MLIICGDAWKGQFEEKTYTILTIRPRQTSSPPKYKLLLARKKYGTLINYCNVAHIYFFICRKNTNANLSLKYLLIFTDFSLPLSWYQFDFFVRYFCLNLAKSGLNNVFNGLLEKTDPVCMELEVILFGMGKEFFFFTWDMISTSML